MATLERGEQREDTSHWSSWERRRKKIAVPLSEGEHEKHGFRIWFGFFWCLLTYCDDSGMSLTMEQVVTLFKQEIITLRAQVADRTGLADAVRAMNSLETAEVRKDAPSLIDVKGLGRPKDLTLGFHQTHPRLRRAADS